MNMTPQKLSSMKVSNQIKREIISKGSAQCFFSSLPIITFSTPLVIGRAEYMEFDTSTNMK